MEEKCGIRSDREGKIEKRIKKRRKEGEKEKRV